MATATITLETQLPEDVYQTLQARGVFREQLSRQTRQLLALRFYQERLLLLGQAARLADCSRWAFIELLADNGMPVLDYTEEELAVEFEAVVQLEQALEERA